MCAENNAPTTQKELAVWRGVSQPVISDYKNGVMLPKMEIAIIMAEKFGCTVEWLLTGRGNKYLDQKNDYMMDISHLSDKQKVDLKTFINSLSEERQIVNDSSNTK